MTHTNHRRGTRESLEGDWIVFSSGTGIDNPDAYKKYNEIVNKHNPVGRTSSTTIDGKRKRLRYYQHWEKKFDSGVHNSATFDEILGADSSGGGGAVYDNKEAMQGVIKDLVEADLGLSIVISGIFEDVYEMAENAGIKVHTVNLSAETMGNMSLMPEPEILDFTTMCGHGYLANSLVEHLLGNVKRGEMTPEHAAVEMSKPCLCNYVNVVRATKLVNDYLEKHK